MLSTIPSVMYALSDNVTPQEALSGIFGSVSLATWIFLLVPQLILNYKTGRADGISLAFLTVWLIGDITNLSGAVWADLVPTVIALAIYFCFADVVLISQCVYYNHINSRRRHDSVISVGSEQEPLLTRRRSSDTLGLPGSHRRRSSARSGTSQRSDSLAKILEEDDSESGNSWVRNSLSILGVMLVGTAGWAVAWQAGVWRPSPVGDVPSVANETAFGAKILGYTSAVCYLGARIPQIVKNYRDKSCEGLALLFFILSLMGNLTYGASILCHSLEKDYVLTNLPWLIGSLGTIAEDAIIFMQFRIYTPKQSTSAITE
ncbi:putative vacuolar amino acid transporter [Lachnellula suecica]|uniref:Putative vacuolar amino acid transporter n=1 Tax=Lachnellula suecica TaxID=602035 RepID=A0A8T9BTE1_9HELO|nr:putative vacuolar amino acid transporter [Lachnellula suecica]